MSGFVRLAEGILFWQVQETGSRVSEGIFTEAVFLGISVLVGMGLFLLYDIFVFSEESCHMAQSGLEWKTSVIGYYALLRFF